MWGYVMGGPGHSDVIVVRLSLQSLGVSMKSELSYFG